VRKISSVFLAVAILISGCSIGGDITPPPALASSQAGQALIQPTALPQPTQTTEAELVPVVAPSSERGASTYIEKCAPCHGEFGLADGSQANQLPNPVAPIGDPVLARAANPADWYDIVSRGNIEKFMPGFESLTDLERWDVVAYTFSLSQDPTKVQLGEEIYTGLCIDCHGAESVGSESAPALTHFQWLAQNSKDDIAATIEEGREPGMPAFAEVLSEEESGALAEYIYSLSFPAAEGQRWVEAVEMEGDPAEDVAGQGIIRGQVNNGSEGGLLADVLEVTLYGFDGQQEAFSETTIADEDGFYSFEGLELVPDRIFIATVDYQGIIYASEVAHFIEETELDLPIIIFETTQDLVNLQIDRLHVIIDMPSEGILEVTELWILSNLGDRTISSETGDGILPVQLPEGAANLNFESGMLGTRFQVTADGFIDLYPVRPGEGSHEIVFSFNMPLDKSLDFSQAVAYPVEAIVMLAPEGIVNLKGEGVQDMGVRQMTGMTLHNYSMGPLSPGNRLEFQVKREAGAGMAFSGSSSVVEIILGVLVFIAALGGTGVWLYRRKREQSVDLEEFEWSEDPTEDLEVLNDREGILQALADLDDSYEADEVKEAFYQSRRKALKSRLLEIMKQADDD
jgi:mono/diheme cytochrome c family protein